MRTADYLNRENDLLDGYLIDVDMSGGLYEEYKKVSKKAVKKTTKKTTKKATKKK